MSAIAGPGPGADSSSSAAGAAPLWLGPLARPPLPLLRGCRGCGRVLSSVEDARGPSMPAAATSLTKSVSMAAGATCCAGGGGSGGTSPDATPGSITESASTWWELWACASSSNKSCSSSASIRKASKLSSEPELPLLLSTATACASACPAATASPSGPATLPLPRSPPRVRWRLRGLASASSMSNIPKRLRPGPSSHPPARTFL
jgi:hypothetical protein